MKQLTDQEYDKFLIDTTKKLDKAFEDMLHTMTKKLYKRKLTIPELEIALKIVEDKSVLRIDEIVNCSIKLAEETYD
jgi:hypothetical protein